MIRNAPVLDGSLRAQTASCSFQGSRSPLEDLVPNESVMEAFEVTKVYPGLGSRTVRLNSREMWREANPTKLILLWIEDITNRKRREEQTLRDYEASECERDRLENLDDKSPAARHQYEEIIGTSAAMQQALPSALSPRSSV